MPPRRRNKANSARSAAIKAVRKRTSQQGGGGEENNGMMMQQQNTLLNNSNCRFPNPKMNQCLPIVTDKKSLFNSLKSGGSKDHDNEDDDVPDLVDHNDERITTTSTSRDNGENNNDYEQGTGEGGEYISEDEEEEDDVEEDEEDDDDEDDEGCLHCHSMSNDIQVHCDECQAYVCEECHWCHEYQANHEIRVCDRCDAFYCRGCDEMDQCEDCGEVVCASCSTLLSCKFCGGGLCEECATACGRCGIVLCSRDAKFAVECDTCRLSYCLVCLASGSKDPCVRCGHRPSKRMEQLVHLRLKSIYKAFKQSSSNPSGKMGPYPGHGGRNTTTIEELEDFESEEYEPDPGILMAAKAASGHMPDSTKSALHFAAREMDLEHALVENYIQEKQKADAAAEALLAELDEEEEAAKSKKSKKKRKKERQQAAKREEEEKKRREEEEKAKKAAAEAKKVQQKQEDMSKKKDSSPKPTASFKDTASSAPSKQSPELPPQFDDVEVKLCQLVEDGDTEGIEEILFALKGVPGRAALRKNAKKALKRLRTAKETPPPAVVPMKEATVAVATPKKLLPNVKTESIPSKRVNGTKSIPPSAVAAPTTNLGTSSSTTTTHRLKIVSDTAKSNRHECVMQMSSALVGWVIGKGGQRIRDMMEESGAKIWIDQEKAKAADCRNVYVSGERKCVDKAVEMVQELVSKASTNGHHHHHQQQSHHPPPQSEQVAKESKSTDINLPQIRQQPVEKQPSKQHPPILAKTITANTGIPAATVPKPVESRTVPPKEPARVPEATVPTVKKPMENHISTIPDPTPPPLPEMEQKPAFQQILTCEACFVPLLIGKRGWTIKSIQDESGARVDIDQTVTPRQIKVSGLKTNVEVAIRMVRDVLSYPHAQLQQPEGTATVAAAGVQTSPPHPSQLTTTPDANGLLSAATSSTPDAAMRSAAQQPPPYSLPSNQMIPPPSVRPQMPPPPVNGARPVHLSAGPPFLMGPPPSITGIGMPPPQPLQPPPPFGQVPPPPADFMMGGMRGAGPPSATLQPNPPPSMASSQQQPQQQQQQQQQQKFPQYTTMDATTAGKRSTVPQSQGLWNSAGSSYMNGGGGSDGLNSSSAGGAGGGPGAGAPTAAATQSLFGPEPPLRQQDSDLIDSLFGPADKSKADDAQIDALFGLSALAIDDTATGEPSSGLWGPSSLTDWAAADTTTTNHTESSSSLAKDHHHHHHQQQLPQQQPPPAALPGLTESFLQRGGKALQHPPESRFDWSSMGSS